MGIVSSWARHPCCITVLEPTPALTPPSTHQVTCLPLSQLAAVAWHPVKRIAVADGGDGSDAAEGACVGAQHAAGERSIIWWRSDPALPAVGK